MAETSIWPTHLMLAIPAQCGTMTRTGYPLSGGSGSPFISYARITSSSALATGIGRRTRPWLTPAMMRSGSSPDGMTATASRVIPARSRTTDSGTPRQAATPIAPSRQGVPGTAWPCWAAKRLRPSSPLPVLPALSLVSQP